MTEESAKLDNVQSIDMRDPDPTPDDEIVFRVWLSEYTSAQLTPPRIIDMANAANGFLAREKQSARAVAVVNGGVYDKQKLRRIACLEAARDLLVVLSRVWDSVPSKVQRSLMGADK